MCGRGDGGGAENGSQKSLLSLRGEGATRGERRVAVRSQTCTQSQQSSTCQENNSISSPLALYSLLSTSFFCSYVEIFCN
ncbi:hypothetical protein AOLI_G00278570 [Acnodon oligacanthus]